MDQLTEELPSPVTIALNDAPCPADKEAEDGVIEICPWARSKIVALAFRFELFKLVAVTVTFCADGITLGA